MVARLKKALFLVFFSAASLLAVFTMTVNAQNAIEPITIYYLERVPYFYSSEDGDARGLIVERVRLVFEKAGVPFQFKLLPTKRHMAYLKNREANFCTIGWYKTDERLGFAKYSAYIHQNKSRIALTRADNTRLRSGERLEDVLLDRELTLLVRDGYSYGPYIDKKVSELKPVIRVLPLDNSHMLKMIYAQRGDYLFTSQEEADVMIADEGFEKSDFKYVWFKNMPSGLKRYILYSRGVKDELIQKVDLAIRRYLH